jgi:molecular chaperone GrpE (heat shock protein)
MTIIQELTSTPDSGSQINPNIHNQDLSTNVYQVAEGDANDNVFDVSDVMRKLASRIESLENSIETTAILRKQKEAIEEDLKKYVTGYNLSIFRMAAIDLIDAYEYLFEALEMLEKLSFPESKEIKQYFKPVSMYLEQGLAAVGVEQFTPDKHVPYISNPGCDLIHTIQTIDKEKEGLIAEVEKAGWRSTLPTDSTQKEILRKAKVSVFERLEK